MPFNTVLVASTASKSADFWQQVACLSERVTNHQLLDLFIGLPLRHLGRWGLYLWTYLCVSPTYSNTASFSEDSDSNSDEGSGGSGLSSSLYHRNGLREYHYSSSSSSSHSD